MRKRNLTFMLILGAVAFIAIIIEAIITRNHIWTGFLFMAGAAGMLMGAALTKLEGED